MTCFPPKFQFTPPHGGTGRRGAGGPHLGISIHAPREGSDITSSTTAGSSRNFNPRSPRGERHHRERPLYPDQYFNPRSPRGERPVMAVRRVIPSNFNPRSPRGERQQNLTKRLCQICAIVRFCAVQQIESSAERYYKFRFERIGLGMKQIMSANLLEKSERLPFALKGSKVPPADMFACIQNARSCFHSVCPDSRTAGCLSSHP